MNEPLAAPAVLPAPTARPYLLLGALYRWCRERQDVIEQAYVAVYDENDHCIGYLEWRKV